MSIFQNIPEITQSIDNRRYMTESYDVEMKERERTEVKDTDAIAKEASDFALKTLLEINERYKKINGLEE
jgi:uncharacterized lipoprotein YehR (DUF1307 family)